MIEHTIKTRRLTNKIHKKMEEQIITQYYNDNMHKDLCNSDEQYTKFLSDNEEEICIDIKDIKFWYSAKENKYIEPIPNYKFRIYKRNSNIYFDMQLNIYLSDIQTIIVCNYIPIPLNILYLVSTSLLSIILYSLDTLTTLSDIYDRVDSLIDDINFGNNIYILYDRYLTNKDSFLRLEETRTKFIEQSIFIDFLKLIDYKSIIRPLIPYFNSIKKICVVDENSNQRNIIDDLKEDIEQLKDNKILDIIKSIKDKNEHSIDSIDTEIKEHTDKIKQTHESLKQRIEGTEKNIAELNNIVARLETERHKNEEHNKKLKYELEHAYYKMNAMTVKMHILEDDSLNLEKERETMKKMINDLETDKNLLNIRITDITQKETIIEDEKQQLINRIKYLEIMNNIQYTSKKILNKLESENSILNDEKQQLINRRKELEIENSILNDEKQQLTIEIKELKTMIDKQVETENALNKLELDYCKLNDENQQLRNRITQLENEKQQNVACNTCSNTLKITEELHNKYQVQDKIREKHNKELRRENISLQDKIEQLTKTIIELKENKSEINKLQLQYDTLNISMNIMKNLKNKEIEKHLQEIISLKSDLEHANESIKQLEEQNKSLQNNNILIETIKKLEVDICILQTEKDDKIRELTQRIHTSDSEFTIIYNLMNDNKLLYVREIESVTKTIKKLEDDKVMLHTHISELESRIASLNKENEDLTLEISKRHERMQLKESEIIELNNKIQVAEETLNSLSEFVEIQKI